MTCALQSASTKAHCRGGCDSNCSCLEKTVFTWQLRIPRSSCCVQARSSVCSDWWMQHQHLTAGLGGFCLWRGPWHSKRAHQIQRWLNDSFPNFLMWCKGQICNPSVWKRSGQTSLNYCYIFVFKPVSDCKSVWALSSSVTFIIALENFIKVSRLFPCNVRVGHMSLFRDLCWT